MKETNYQEIYEKIRDMAFATRRAIGNTAAPGGHIERAKNVLYNNMDAIEDALRFAASAAKQMEILEVELADAEREIDELTKKTTQKKKTKATADEQQG